MQSQEPNPEVPSHPPGFILRLDVALQFALDHPTRREILRVLHHRPEQALSPSDIFGEITRKGLKQTASQREMDHQNVRNIAYHIKALEKYSAVMCVSRVTEGRNLRTYYRSKVVGNAVVTSLLAASFPLDSRVAEHQWRA